MEPTMSRIVVVVAFAVVLSTAGQAAAVGIDFGGTIDHSNHAAHLIDSF